MLSYDYLINAAGREDDYESRSRDRKEDDHESRNRDDQESRNRGFKREWRNRDFW